MSENNLIRISLTSIRPEEISGLIELVTKYSKKVDFNNLSIFNTETNKNTSIALTIIPKNKKFINLNHLSSEINKSYPEASFTILDSQSL